MNRASLALLALVLVAACAALRPGETVRVPRAAGASSRRLWERDGAAGEGVSHAIFPTQTIPLRFDHARHLAIAGVTCVRCHEQATRSAHAGDRLVPPESTCTPCHAIDREDPTREARPAARCDACHEGFDVAAPMRVARVDIPASNINFSHAAHLQRGATCERCHGAMRDVGLGTRLDLPTMRSCFECHASGRTASGDCRVCHLVGADGRLRTQFPEGSMNPPAWMTGLHHDPDYWFTHRSAAADNASRCGSCHRESDCADCHDGRVRDRRTHPNDFLTFHGAEARQSTDRCGACHRAATFCEACHARSGVSLQSPAAARATGRFHPPQDEWSGRMVGPRHHAMEARRSLAACVSCHAERDCTSCHAVLGMGGGGINPHPPGWLDRCGAMLAASPRACAQCHDDVGSLTGRCR